MAAKKKTIPDAYVPPPPAGTEKGDWKCKHCGEMNKHFIIGTCLQCWGRRDQPPAKKKKGTKR